MAKNKSNSKKDKAFIDKINTINIGGKSSAKEKCECGADLQPVGHLKGQFYGKEVEGHVYAHGPVPPEMLQRKRQPKPRASTDEFSFSA
jgi:hypothetical protein